MKFQTIRLKITSCKRNMDTGIDQLRSRKYPSELVLIMCIWVKIGNLENGMELRDLEEISKGK